jgi:hypothetical protein
MKNSIITSILCSFLLMACSEDTDPIILQEPGLDGSSYSLQVSLHSSPEVFEEGFNHHTQQVEQIQLDYNRQVFVDLDAASETSNADVLGVHYNEDSFVKLDVWDDTKDHVEGIDGWDIVLSNYNGRVDSQGTLVPYGVTGALINKGKVQAIRLHKEEIEEQGGTFISYDAITYDQAVEFTLDSEVDAIGHDWKSYSFASSSFVMIEDQYYIIKSTEGLYFKLAFTSFYDDNLDKGNPKFIFQRILAE